MNEIMFEKNGLKTRTESMLKADLIRMTRSKLFYIPVACALVVPILMIVMTTMTAGTEKIDPSTGETIVTQVIFTNVWQSIGALPDAESGGMDLTAMCNIDMMFMAAAVFVCLFISEDFKCGYAKNLFTVRAKKTDYVISKTVCGVICGIAMLLAYFVGALLSGKLVGLSFELSGFSVVNIVMCMLSKLCLMLVFVPIFVTISVAAKQKTWLAICGSLGGGMLLFMMVGMVSPLTATVMNVVLCLAGGAMFSVGLGAVSNAVLRRSALA